jgi:hypothetical protein
MGAYFVKRPICRPSWDDKILVDVMLSSYEEHRNETGPRPSTGLILLSFLPAVTGLMWRNMQLTQNS